MVSIRKLLPTVNCRKTYAAKRSAHPHVPPCPEFTTLTAIAGEINYNGAKIQIVDLRKRLFNSTKTSLLTFDNVIQPVSSRVRKTVKVVVNRSLRVSTRVCERSPLLIWNLLVARTCNLIFIVLDVLKPLNDLKILTNELEGFGIRLNKQPPNIVVKKREKGGVSPSRDLLRLVPNIHVADPNHEYGTAY